MFSRRVSCFTLRDESGRILLQHRDSGAPRCPEMWAFFGGEIERGETPERALRREAREELGIELDSPELFGTFEFQEDDGWTCSCGMKSVVFPFQKATSPWSGRCLTSLTARPVE